MIGQRKTTTNEFSIYKMRTPYANKGEAYLVELDGVNLAASLSVAKTHIIIKAHAKRNDLAGAGVTEVFGRNRQFTITPRFAFKRFDNPSETS